MDTVAQTKEPRTWQDVIEPVNDERREDIDLGALFPSPEHGLYAYFGRLGQGKTYAMTEDILRALNRGEVVYTNYPINWQGFDESKHWQFVFFYVIGLKKFLYRIQKENLRRIDVDEKFHDNFQDLTDCIVALDEGYVAFDSYEMAKLSMQKRQNVLHARHFDRSIWYTVQRPSNIHVVMRGNTNVFYRIRKVWTMFFVVFFREEFDLDSDERVNVDDRLGLRLYIGKKRVFEAYDTKYLRMGKKSSQRVAVELLRPSYAELLDGGVRAVRAWLETRRTHDDAVT